MKARTRTIDEQLYKSIIVFAKQKIKTHFKTPTRFTIRLRNIEGFRESLDGTNCSTIQDAEKIDEIIKI